MDHETAMKKVSIIEDTLDELYGNFKEPELVAYIQAISKKDADVPESKLIQRDDWDEERYRLLKRIYLIAGCADELSNISTEIMKDFPGFELCA